MLKKGARVLGIDDSPFDQGTKSVLVVGVVYRDGIVEAVLSTSVERDGEDATERVTKMIRKSRFADEIRLIFMNGIMLAGFNVVDIRGLSERLHIPVIALVRKKPNMKEVRKALAHVKNSGQKLALIRRAGRVLRHKYYMQIAGMSFEDARAALGMFAPMPEPIRLAHVIASGVVRGESKGRA
ncbi:MAG: DUF99 family protein [Candidatus Micrarchaeota archaeon]